MTVAAARHNGFATVFFHDRIACLPCLRPRSPQQGANCDLSVRLSPIPVRLLWIWVWRALF